MKTLVTKHIVSVKLQALLFAFSLLMHMAASSVQAEHPLLGWLLATLEMVGWICVLAIALTKGIQYVGPTFWTNACRHVHLKKAKNRDLIASEEQLKRLRTTIQQLGLALHGVTPEQEQARRMHFQQRGEALPDLVIPAQHPVLSAEFLSLVWFLNHRGFPHLESVRLQKRDFEFAQQWADDLEARLQEAQRAYAYQQQTMEWLLGETCKAFEQISIKYPQAPDDAGYQRIHGALKLLKKPLLIVIDGSLLHASLLVAQAFRRR